MSINLTPILTIHVRTFRRLYYTFDIQNPQSIKIHSLHKHFLSHQHYITILKLLHLVASFFNLVSQIIVKQFFLHSFIFFFFEKQSEDKKNLTSSYIDSLLYSHLSWYQLLSVFKLIGAQKKCLKKKI